MVFTLTRAALALALAAAATALPADDLAKRGLTYSGCFSSSQGLSGASSYIYQSYSHCQGECNGGQSVMALVDGTGCLCGNSLPPASSQVSDSMCNVPCAGYGQNSCGGTNYYSVFLTGAGTVQGSSGSSSNSNGNDGATQTTSAATPTSTTATVVTSIAPGQTIVVTQSATPTSTSSSSGGSNTAGIAAGVVVGLVAIAGIIGGAYFFIRRRRQKAIAEEHRQKAGVSDFIAGGMERKTPAPTFRSVGPDSRLDPEAGRRNSFGSVMDDSQDYSRKILRVANPDD